MSVCQVKNLQGYIFFHLHAGHSAKFCPPGLFDKQLCINHANLLTLIIFLCCKYIVSQFAEHCCQVKHIIGQNL